MKIVSIGVCDTVTKTPKYFERKSSAPESGQQLVNEFLTHLVNVYEIYKSTVDPYLFSALGNLYTKKITKQF